MASLYEIEAQIMALIDAETGEFTDLDALEQLELDRQTKLENIALLIKNLESDAAAYKAEKLNFADKQQRAESRIESLKAYLSGALGGENFKTTRVACTFRNNERVEVEDISLLPEEFKKYSQPTADKKAIKEAIKNGKEVSGAVLVKGVSFSVK